MNHKIKTLIVDDELNACKNIEKTLQENSDSFDIIGFVRNTTDAEAYIKKHNPDLIFIDISMPKENGIEFLERIQPFSFRVVFITAYSNFALKALKLEAIDYILKPIDLIDFKKCILKIEKIFDIGQKTNVPKSAKNHLLIKSVDDALLIEIDSIIYLEAKGAYVEIYYYDGLKTKSTFSSKNIGYYENTLSSFNFIRPHKSYLTHRSKVKKIENSITSPRLILENDHKIPIAIKKKGAIIKLINGLN